MPVSKPCFSAVSMISCAVPWRLHSAMNAASAGFFCAAAVASGWSGEIAMKLRAEQRVLAAW